MADRPDASAWPSNQPEVLRVVVRSHSPTPAPSLTMEAEGAWARAMIAVNADGRGAQSVVEDAHRATGVDPFPHVGYAWRVNPYLPAGWVFYVEWPDEDPAECGLWCLGSEDTLARLGPAARERAVDQGQLGLWRLRKDGSRYRR